VGQATLMREMGRHGGANRCLVPVRREELRGLVVPRGRSDRSGAVRGDGARDDRDDELRPGRLRGTLRRRRLGGGDVRLPPLRRQRGAAAATGQRRRPARRLARGCAVRPEGATGRPRPDSAVGHLVERRPRPDGGRRRSEHRRGRRATAVHGCRPARGESALGPGDPHVVRGGDPRRDRRPVRAAAVDGTGGGRTRDRGGVHRQRGLRRGAPAGGRGAGMAQRDGRPVTVLPAALPAGCPCRASCHAATGLCGRRRHRRVADAGHAGRATGPARGAATLPGRPLRRLPR
jgi:hypothetical protein